MDKTREEFERLYDCEVRPDYSFDAMQRLVKTSSSKFVAEFICNLVASLNDYKASAARASEWVSVDTLPENCQPVYVEEPQCYRFHHYKPISQQYKKGIKGRWQKFDGYGWNNCEAPARYKLEGPSDE